MKFRTNRLVKVGLILITIATFSAAFLYIIARFTLMSDLQVPQPQSANAGALAKLHCASARLSQLDSIWDLPVGVISLLGNSRWKLGLNPIADRGEEFNATDVIRADRPNRQFTIAGASDTCALTAVEVGGDEAHVDLYAFERRGEGWEGGQFGTSIAAPKSLADLRGVLDSSNTNAQ